MASPSPSQDPRLDKPTPQRDGSPRTDLIHVQCRCGQRVSVPASAAGRRGKCPKCGSVLALSGGSAASPRTPVPQADALDSRPTIDRGGPTRQGPGQGLPGGDGAGTLWDDEAFRKDECSPSSCLRCGDSPATVDLPVEFKWTPILGWLSYAFLRVHLLSKKAVVCPSYCAGCRRSIAFRDTFSHAWGYGGFLLLVLEIGGIAAFSSSMTVPRILGVAIAVTLVVWFIGIATCNTLKERSRGRVRGIDGERVVFGLPGSRFVRVSPNGRMQPVKKTSTGAWVPEESRGESATL